jgi:hypothetical protein
MGAAAVYPPGPGHRRHGHRPDEKLNQRLGYAQKS